LDRDVSGVLVLAKSLQVAEQLREQFAARKPDRQYIAIVAGVPRKPQDTIRSYLATDANLNRYSVPPPTSISKAEFEESEPRNEQKKNRKPKPFNQAKPSNAEYTGELAITHYKVRHAWADSALVEVRLETGRRNQIRVHLA
jgi:23S rRNA pseudouridine1911/1915/1917 synthase